MAPTLRWFYYNYIAVLPYFALTDCTLHWPESELLLHGHTWHWCGAVCHRTVKKRIWNLLRLFVKVYKLTLFLMSGLHPASRRTRQVSLWPFWQQRWRGANPPLFLMYALALALHKIPTLWLNPFQAASCKAVFPCFKKIRNLNKPFRTRTKPLTTSSWWSTLIPLSKRVLMTSTWPSAAALCKAVCPVWKNKDEEPHF